MHGCESELLGEKVPAAAAASLRAAGGQPDSTEDRRSTMLERHSRLEAPPGLSPNVSVREEHKVINQTAEVDMFHWVFRGLACRLLFIFCYLST